MKYSKQDAYLALLGADFGVFLRQCFITLYTGKEFMDNWHIDAIVYHLECAIRGEMPRLIVNLPPRHLKSFIISVALPAFILGNDPTAKIICISYSDELTKTLMQDFRRIMDSEWYKKRFANVMPSKMTQNEFLTTDGGFRYATSVGGTLTGRGGDFIIVDDPIKPEDVLSDKMRESTNEWYKNTLLSRLEDKAKSVLILVMQRLHVNDPAGFIEASGGYHKLSFPAIALKDEDIPISENEFYHRREREPLQADREDIETLEKIRDQIGPHNFASQYQQTPEAPDGAMFKKTWFQFVSKVPPRTPDGHFIISIDTASSKTETADYTAIMFMYSDSTGHYVLRAHRGRWEYSELEVIVSNYVRKYPDATFIVESANIGIAIISTLRKAGTKCFSARPKDSKLMRASWILPTVHKKKVHIVNMEGKNEWVDPFMNEILSFPHGRFDDYVDCFTQAVQWADGRIIVANVYTVGAG
jgi:predicted phage terminase large subunit-like protein